MKAAKRRTARNRATHEALGGEVARVQRMKALYTASTDEELKKLASGAPKRRSR